MEMVWVILTLVCTSEVCAPKQVGDVTYADSKECDKVADSLVKQFPKQKFKCDWWIVK